MVDDDAPSAQATATVLGRWGARVVTFTSAEIASEIAPSLGVGVLITEYHLAGLGAAEVCARLRASTLRAPPRCVVLTRDLHAMPIPERARYDAVLPKPLSITSLREVLDAPARP